MDFFKKLRSHFNKNQQIKRAERLRLQSYNKLKLHYQEKEYNIVNITTGGLAFEPGADTFHVDPRYQMDLGNSESEKISVDVEVRHLANGFCGCKVHDIDNKYANFVFNFLSDELKGQKASYFGADQLNGDSEGIPFWYFYNSQYEIYFVEHDERLVKFKATILDTCIEYHYKKGLQFSLFVEDNFSPDGHESSGVFDTIITPHEDRIVNAIRFIDNIRLMDKAYRRQITNVLQTFLIKQNSSDQQESA